MKTLPSGLATHVGQVVTTLAYALGVKRPDGTVYGLTTSRLDATISGVVIGGAATGSVVYKARPGLAVTNIELTAGLNVDNLELTTLDDGTIFTKADVLEGRWRNSAFLLFRYNWANLSDGIDPLIAGTFGEISLNRNTVVAELRGLQQALQQGMGSPSTKTCRARLGDAKCRKDLTAFRFNDTVTTAGQKTFTASAVSQGTDYFTEGEVLWLTGANAGVARKVQAYTTGGVFTLAEAMLHGVLIGDTFRATAGCMKRLAEDCVTKFANAVNFLGEPHRPKVNDLIRPPEPNV